MASRNIRARIAAFSAFGALLSPPALAQDQGASAPEPGSDEHLAQQLSNPIANLISVPIQENLDFGMGPQNEGWRSTTNVQPVIPISLGSDWSMISRTIMPVIYQDHVTAPEQDQFGLGDVTQSLFFSPKNSGGLIWGVGPVFVVPTATDSALGGKKWGAGPTAVMLKQAGPITIGLLANHVWSFAGSNKRSDVSATFMQPFVTYTTKKAMTVTLNTETTYDWKAEQWNVPVNLTVSQLTKIGNQRVSFGIGGKYYVERPTGGADWGMRVILTFLFPKG